MPKKFMTTTNKKIIATAGLIIAGWHAITMSFADLPHLPTMLDTGMGIALAGMISLWTAWMLWNEY